MNTTSRETAPAKTSGTPAPSKKPQAASGGSGTIRRQLRGVPYEEGAARLSPTSKHPKPVSAADFVTFFESVGVNSPVPQQVRR